MPAQSDQTVLIYIWQKAVTTKGRQIIRQLLTSGPLKLSAFLLQKKTKKQNTVTKTRLIVAELQKSNCQRYYFIIRLRGSSKQTALNIHAEIYLVNLSCLVLLECTILIIQYKHVGNMVGHGYGLIPERLQRRQLSARRHLTDAALMKNNDPWWLGRLGGPAGPWSLEKLDTSLWCWMTVDVESPPKTNNSSSLLTLVSPLPSYTKGLFFIFTADRFQLYKTNIIKTTDT